MAITWTKNRNAAAGSHEAELRDDDINEIVAEINALEVAALGNATPVASKSDFPEPVAGVITLVSGQVYRISGVINLGTDRINTNGASLLGSNSIADQITYTGTSPMLTCTGNSFFSNDLTYNCPNSDWIDFNGSGSNFLIVDRLFVFSDTLGSIETPEICSMNSIQFNSTVEGFIFTGTSDVTNIDICAFGGVTGTAIDVTSYTVNRMRIVECSASPDTGDIFLDALAAGANFVDGLQVAVCTFVVSGSGAVLNTIDVNDLKVDFRDNVGLQETHHKGEVFVANGAEAATPIAAPNTPVKVAGTFTEFIARRFTTDATGRITYHNGVAEEPFRAYGAVCIEPASGTGNQYSLYIYKNGSQCPSSRKTIVADNNKIWFIAVTCELDMTDGDYIELWIECNSGTVNPTCHAAQLEID